MCLESAIDPVRKLSTDPAPFACKKWTAKRIREKKTTREEEGPFGQAI